MGTEEHRASDLYKEVVVGVLGIICSSAGGKEDQGVRPKGGFGANVIECLERHVKGF